MSSQQVQANTFNNADISFLRGYKKHRSSYRLTIVFNVLVMVLFIIFIPIDSTLLIAGDNIIVAEAVPLAVAFCSLVISIYQYCTSFIKFGVSGYSQLARDLLHATDEPITSYSSIQSCTSQTIFHAASGIVLLGFDQKTIDVYTNVARQEVEEEMGRRLPQLHSWANLQLLLSLSSMLIVIIFMGKCQNMNAAQIAVLVVYLVCQAFLKIKFLIVLILVVLSPLFCIGLIIYACCCAPSRNQEGGVLDLVVIEANLDQVVKCSGECAICMQDVKLKETIYQLPCSDKHIFHSGCLDKWMRVKGNCPTCRADLPMKGGQV